MTFIPGWPSGVTGVGGPLGAISVVSRAAGLNADAQMEYALVGIWISKTGTRTGGGMSSGSTSGRVVVTAGVLPAPSRTELREAALRAQYPLPPPPVPTFSRGPKGAGITLTSYRRYAQASSATAQAVFHRWGFTPVTGARVYWEFVADAYAATLGGFGVGEVYTTVDAEPGKGDNPGCMMYLESGALSVWNNGEETTVGALAAGTRFGVAVHIVGPQTADMAFYVDGAWKAEVRYVFDGPMWIPTLCTLSTAKFSVLQAANTLSFVPTGYVPLIQCPGARFDFERQCADIPVETPVVSLSWPSDVEEQQSHFVNDDFIYNLGAACHVDNPAAYQCNGIVSHISGRNRGVIYSAGEENDTWMHSSYEYDHAGETFILGRVKLTTDNTVLIGAGRMFSSYYNQIVGFTQGVGAAPAWEFDGMATQTLMSEAMFSVFIETASTYYKGIARVFGDIDETWYEEDGITTKPTPVDVSIDAAEFYELAYDEENDEWSVIGPAGDIEIAAGDYMEVRLFESYLNSRGDTEHVDLVYAPMTIDIYAAT